MAFIEYIIDIVRNGSVIQQKVNAERDATDQARISPARVIQLNGNPLSESNALPVALKSEEIGATNSPVATNDTGAFSLNSLLKRLLTKIPSLIGGRLPVDGSGVVQPISGVVSVSNFPASSGSGSAGVQYPDNTAVPTPTGNVVLANKSGTLKTLQLDTNNNLLVSSVDIGTQADVAATADTGTFSLLSALKRFLGRFSTYLGVFGTVADVADTTGSLMARLRAALDRVGSFGDAASTTGSLMAQLRWLGDNLAIGYGDGTTQANPKGSLFLAKGSGINAGKVIGLTLDANNILPVSIPNAINLADFTTPANKLAINASGFIGVSTLPNVIGGIGDASSSVGSLSAQLRFICESLNRVTITTPISESAAGDRTIIAATPGKQIVITNLYFVVDTATNITFKNGTTSISGAMPISAHSSDDTRIILSTNTAFVINLSVASNLRGYVIWYLM